jgi:peptidoglycan/LPS O-acetylase OafA/YrhL
VTSSFRPEIAGLRALAVMSVVLFHLKVGGFQGGFVGVDVFYVISGYLISRIIIFDLQAEKFSLGQFYVRRTRRIFPALIFTVAATYIVGALWCSPKMFLDVAKECTHALLSIANIQYWRESHQYFAPRSDELALLHFWSLSVEEQFYLIWPIFIVLAKKTGRIRDAIIIATLGSFGASIAVAKTDPLAVFFLMPFRIFEFGCGALIIFVERFRLGRAAEESLSAAGILAVIASALFVRSDLPYLEFAMLVPCLGTVATILAGNKTRASGLITNPVMIGIGAISYSLYLCHWPIIFFARFIFGEGVNEPIGIIAMLATMFLVAFLMYKHIERRFIQPSEFRSSFWKTAAAFWSVVLTLVAITHTTFLSKGFAWRLSAEEAELIHLQEYPTGRDIEPVEGPVAVQLVGDSHAVQYEAGLSSLTKRLNLKMEVLGGAGCPILTGIVLRANRIQECVKIRDQTLAQLSQTSLPMIFVQKWDFYDDAAVDYDFDAESGRHSEKHSYMKLERALERTIEQIGTHGRRVLLIGSQVYPNCPINPPRLSPGPLPHAPPRPCPPRKRETIEQSGAHINQMLSRIQARWPGRIELLQPVDFICDAECPVIKDGIWLYSDYSHFSVAGSRYIVRRAEIPLAKFLEPDPVRQP